MTATPDLPDAVVAYFANRRAARHAHAAEVFGSLTDRERALFKDAAVMGFVQGLMRDREEGVPKDSQIVALVVEACLAQPDLYPAIAAEPTTNRCPACVDGTCTECDGDGCGICENTGACPDCNGTEEEQQ